MEGYRKNHSHQIVIVADFFDFVKKSQIALHFNKVSKQIS